LLRSINHKNTLTMKAGSLRPRNLRRRMSVKGAIKKTRSINVDCKYLRPGGSCSSQPTLSHDSPRPLFLSTNAAETLGMEGNVTERRLSVAVTPLWLDSSNTSIAPPSAAVEREVSPRPEPDDGLPPNKVQIQTPEVPRIQLPTRHRGATETFENTEVEELIAMLRETENLEDQGDILQYLVDTQGLDFNTGEPSTSSAQITLHHSIGKIHFVVSFRFFIFSFP
jgi:phosphorylase kinase alpha/beta subunit